MSNPIYPKIVLKNYGATTLNSVIIDYTIDASNNYSYSWNGNLGPLETDTVLLPGNIVLMLTLSPIKSVEILLIMMFLAF